MNSPEETKVVVTDIQMPFISMVVFMVKWALAAIPALFILFAIFLRCIFRPWYDDLLLRTVKPVVWYGMR